MTSFSAGDLVLVSPIYPQTDLQRKVGARGVGVGEERCRRMLGRLARVVHTHGDELAGTVRVVAMDRSFGASFDPCALLLMATAQETIATARELLEVTS